MSNNEISTAKTGPLTRFVLATIFCTLLSLVVVLAILHFSPITDILFSHTKYVATKPFADMNQYEQLIAQRMLQEKSLITVDTLWSMQVSFYQTIVSILVGLNAAILAVAFFIIRASSKAEAIRETASRFDEYTSSSSFAKLVQKKAKKEISKVNATYDDVWAALEIQRDELSYLQDDIEVITSRLATLDNSEEDPENNQSLSG